MQQQAAQAVANQNLINPYFPTGLNAGGINPYQAQA
jgi:hypothetical protein